jgi:sulfonate transport system permease protein
MFWMYEIFLTGIEHTIETAPDDVTRSDAGATVQSRKRYVIGGRGLLLISWIAPLVLLVSWEVLAQAGWLSPQVLPAPSKVLMTAFKLAISGSLLNDLGVSMLRAAAGFAIGGGVEAEKIFLVSLGVCFPIYINTTLGIRQVDPKLLELGRVQGLGTWQLIRRIILPGALPSILTGVRYSLATAWLALVVAETIGAQSGLGFLAMDAR